MNPFSFATTAQILCESGSAAQLGELCKLRDAHRVLIVTDPGITKIGLLNDVLPTLAKAQVAAEVFDKVEADPPESVVLAAVVLGHCDEGGDEATRTVRCRERHVSGRGRR